MAEPEIDNERIAAVCRALNEHHVEFIVIAGVAARLHATRHATVDIDICPSSVDENLSGSPRRSARSTHGCESR